MSQEVFVLDPKDNVATLVSEDGKPGRGLDVTVDGRREKIELQDTIPFGHKFAIRAIKAGTPVIKYGHSIGTATVDIQPGQHVHIHNLESNRGRGDLVKGATREGKA